MERVKIAALGDSITKGVVLTEENGYSVLEQNFMEIIKAERGVEVDNYGKFGSTIGFAHHILNHHAEDIATSNYTFIEFGGNDCDFNWKRIALDPSGEHQPKTRLEEFKESFVRLIEKIRALGSKPIILSLPPIGSEEYFDFFSRKMSDEQRANILGWMGGEVEAIGRWHDSYNQVLFGIASQTSTPILDITAPFSNYSGNWHTLLCKDGIHPNSMGHKLIASSIMTAGF
jgi:lysophospholipase L1-like esterase